MAGSFLLLPGTGPSSGKTGGQYKGKSRGTPAPRAPPAHAMWITLIFDRRPLPTRGIGSRLPRNALWHIPCCPSDLPCSPSYQRPRHTLMTARSTRRLVLQWSALLSATFCLAAPPRSSDLQPAPTCRQEGVSPDAGDLQRVLSRPNPSIDLNVPARRGSVPALPAAPAAAVGGPSGMVVAIDPETGQLVPPAPEDLRELSSMSTNPISAASEPVPIQGVDGSPGLDLRGTMQDYATVRIGADGKPVFRCMTSERVPASL